MIAKAKAISYGINDLRYITGESKHKKHPEKIYRVLDNLLPPELDAMGIWNSMQLTLSQHRPIKNSIIRIELSPSPEHTSFYDIEDWQKLWHEFAEEFDKQTIADKDGKVRSCPTNLAKGFNFKSLRVQNVNSSIVEGCFSVAIILPIASIS